MKFLIAALFLASVVLATTNANEDGPHCFCTREMAPLCATNGVTYSNPCLFRCAKNKLQGRAADDFKVARGGPCDGPEMPEPYGELK